MKKSVLSSHSSVQVQGTDTYIDTGGKLRGKREDIGVKRLTVDITAINHAKLKRYCFENDTTFVRAIDELIQKYL